MDSYRENKKKTGSNNLPHIFEGGKRRSQLEKDSRGRFRQTAKFAVFQLIHFS